MEEGLCERIFYAHWQGNKQIKNKEQQSTCDAGHAAMPQCHHVHEKFFITFFITYLM